MYTLRNNTIEAHEDDDRGRTGTTAPKLISFPQTNLFDKLFDLICDYVPPECHKWGTNQNSFCSIRSHYCFVPHSRNGCTAHYCDKWKKKLNNKFKMVCKDDTGELTELKQRK